SRERFSRPAPALGRVRHQDCRLDVLAPDRDRVSDLVRAQGGGTHSIALGAVPHGTPWAAPTTGRWAEVLVQRGCHAHGREPLRLLPGTVSLPVARTDGHCPDSVWPRRVHALRPSHPAGSGRSECRPAVSFCHHLTRGIRRGPGG